MRTWEQYKETFPAEGIFDWARSGDLKAFAQHMTDNPNFDLDVKNNKGYSPLMLAVYNDQEVFAEALIRCGADVNSTDDADNSILMGACYKGNYSVIRMLLLYGADLNFKNQMGMTAYDWAKMFGHKDILRVIEKSGFKKENGQSLIRSYFNLLRLGLKKAF